jgi:hypothetical protein
MRRSSALALSTLAAITLTTGLATSPARAAYPPSTATVQILMTTLVARGAAVDVSFAVDCPAGFTGSTVVSVAQVHDGLTATGTARKALNCVGTGQLYLQRVTADITGAPFARGKATLAMQVVGCDASDCFSTPLNESIRITR